MLHLVIISKISVLQYSVFKKNFPQTISITTKLVNSIRINFMTTLMKALVKKCQQLTYEFLSIIMTVIINISVNNMLITKLHMSMVTRIRENHRISSSTYIFYKNIGNPVLDIKTNLTSSKKEIYNYYSDIVSSTCLKINIQSRIMSSFFKIKMETLF